MVLHDTSPKPFFFQPFQQPRVLQHVIVSKPFVETPSTHRTFHRAVPSPFFLEIELTENQCQSVFIAWVFVLGGIKEHYLCLKILSVDRFFNYFYFDNIRE